VQGATLLIAVIFVVANTIVDIVYGWIDPRISQQ
jgi:ABC-type dipeptide/oligopeptide/nickel transport system permease component